MSDFDPVMMDVRDVGSDGYDFGYDLTVLGEDVPQLIANELRRQYEAQGDPSLYWMILRAQEIESL